MQTIPRLFSRRQGPWKYYFSRQIKNTVMPKKQGKNKRSDDKDKPAATNIPKGCIFEGKNGSIMIEVLAKPGAKTNNITGLTPEGVGVQIAAPPVDGEANSELVVYLSKVLKVRKSDVSLERGSKSRNKTIAVNSDTHTVDSVRTVLEKECSNT